MHQEEMTFYVKIILAIVMLTIIVFTFIISSIIHQKKIIRLNELLLKAEIDILEKERKRIAADLHDELGPILSSVKLYLNAIDTKEEEERIILLKATALLDNAISEIRQISRNLMPVALQDHELNDAVHQLVNHFIDSRSKSVRLTSEISGIHLDKNIEITVFRIIQEILNNIIKHSKATEIDLKLWVTGNLLKIRAEDNGIGFNQENVTGINAIGSGLGLKNITSRVNLLNGKFQIDSVIGKGTEVNLEIPIRKSKY
jgi:two-component system, NarL family, sensor kinase